MQSRRKFLTSSLKFFVFFKIFSSTLFSKTTNHTKGFIMKLTQKTKEVLEKLSIKVENSSLIESDEEFFINHMNFTFAESFTKANLDERTYFLIVLASILSTGGKNEFDFILKTALKNSISPVEIKEVIYQATPYIGFSKVFDFLELCNEIFKQKGIVVSNNQNTQNNRKLEGKEVQNTIFGEANIRKMIENTPKDRQHINDFLSANCFGDYYTRKGLDLKTRELLTFVYLISLGGADNQAKAHMKGNLNMGQTKQSLINVITALIPYIGYPRSLNALNLLNEF